MLKMEFFNGIQDFRNKCRTLDFQGFPPCKRLLQKLSRFGTLPA
jgi:hypothetical protein